MSTTMVMEFTDRIFHGDSTLVGPAPGRNRPQEPVTVARATIHIVLIYIFCMVLLFVFVPHFLLDLFRPDN
jgi:Na+-driven multidrug efflux pump